MRREERPFHNQNAQKTIETTLTGVTRLASLDAGCGQTHPCQRSQICVNSALSAMTKKINSNRAERDG